MIVSRTPLRIEFFGAGTDLPVFSKKEFGCTINMAIDKYIYLIVSPSFYNYHKISYNQIETALNTESIQNERIRETMKKIGINKPIEIHSMGEIPSGTGLGSSGTFTVGLLNALYAYKGMFASKNRLAEDASEIEIEILKEPIGKQDQYAAAYGGINFTKYNTDGSVIIEPIRLKKETLNAITSRLLVFYLGETRSAADILKEHTKSVEEFEEKFLLMKEMKLIALRMKKDFFQQKYENFGKMLSKSWLLKKQIHEKISNAKIDETYECGMRAGALGATVSGAGGGGFILFFCEPENQDKVRRALHDLKELKISLDIEGTKIIYP